ncbi:hypothetical protein PINS_up001938 [Pythium insidiosum]|nr:hypothetical protein PINS_up001938 [Pythium insidiosum]
MALEEDDAFDVSIDLLERARRLCAAANEISLPVLVPPKNVRKEVVLPAPKKPTRDGERKRTESAGSTRSNSDVDASSKTTLARKPKKESVASRSLRDEREQHPEALPRLEATADLWRKQREAEKIRQAQERAKARLLKSNQHELPALKSGPDVPLSAPAEDDKPTQGVDESNSNERERQHALYEESRRRAEERVKERNRHRRRKLAEDKEDEATIPPARRQTKSTGRQKTVETSHIQNHGTCATEEEASTNPPNDNEDREKKRKQLEKKRRHETAKRLLRIQQLAADQERKEQERVESQLQAFKNMRKDMERVGQSRKSRSRHSDRGSTSVSHVQESGSREESECPPELDDFAHMSFDPSNELPDHPPASQQEVLLSIAIDSDRHQEIPVAESAAASHAPSSSGNKNRRRRLPAWKQPPVPVLPAECYVPKAVVSPGQSALVSISSESYASRYQARSGNTSSPTPGSGIFH